ncbi:MAG: DUF4623 domain-containing protein, partial [Limisphaerales bacterium]
MFQKKSLPSGRLGIKQLALVASVAIGAAATNADAQVLSLKWQNTSITTNHRDIAFNPATGNILVAQTGGSIVRIKSVDGTSAGNNLDNTGIAGGTFVLSGVAATKTGTIFACNYVAGAQSTSPLKIYRWDNEDATPVLVTSLATLPGTTSDRFGQNIKVFTTATTTNLLIAGNTTLALMAIQSGETWTIKQLITDNQTMVPGGTFVDYNAPGFPNRFRVIGKSRGTGGFVYNFDPSAASPITISNAATKTAMSGEWSWKANGISSHDYDPRTGLL